MNLGSAKTINEAVNILLQMRRHRPYQYGGKWYVAELDGDGYAYRTLATLKNKAIKLGMDEIEYIIIEKEVM